MVFAFHIPNSLLGVPMGSTRFVAEYGSIRSSRKTKMKVGLAPGTGTRYLEIRLHAGWRSLTFFNSDGRFERQNSNSTI